MMLPRRTFTDAIEDVSRGNPKLPQSAFAESGALPVVDQGQKLIAGYTDDESLRCRVDAPVIVFGDHTRAFKYVDFPFVIGADGVKVLRVREAWDSKYVYHYLRSRDVPSAGYARHFKFLRKIEVPQPSLDEQRRIAAILDHADALRAKRRQVLAHLDTLTQSIFGAMMSSGYPVEPLGQSLTFVTSGGRGWAKYYSETGERFIQSLDVRMGTISDRDPVFVTVPDNAEARRTRTRAGDVLLTITGSRVGRVATLPEELAGAYVSQHVAILRPNPELLRPDYLSTTLGLPNLGQRLIRAAHYGQTKPGLNFEQIRGFPLPRPSLQHQDEFLLRKASVDAISKQMSAELGQAEALFASLQSRAFRGEL